MPKTAVGSGKSLNTRNPKNTELKISIQLMGANVVEEANLSAKLMNKCDIVPKIATPNNQNQNIPLGITMSKDGTDKA